MSTDAEAARADAREVTGLLRAASDGVPDAMEHLVTRVYDDLRRVAHRQLGAEASGHTLDTTALVHEAWLRLADQHASRWADRAQFFAVAARMMRRVLVDHARQHKALRRGGGERAVPLDVLEVAAATSDAAHRASVPVDVAARADELVALDDALARLEAREPRLARVVELRYFAGLTEVEIAGILGVTERTVRRDWSKARDWLYVEVRRALD